MPEPDSGIDLMRRRIERASRRPPPAPRARGAASAPDEDRGDAGAVVDAAAPPVAATGGGGEAAGAPSTRRARRPTPPARPRLAPDLPPVNLAIRVRKPLDDHLADLIDDLRRDGVRTSKVELIEMLLWEQTSEDPRAVRDRLGAFRAAAPRGASAPLS